MHVVKSSTQQDLGEYKQIIPSPPFFLHEHNLVFNPGGWGRKEK